MNNIHQIPYKVLLVEDEVIIAKDISSRLTKMGYEITGTAQSSEMAIDLIEKNLPDIILMDIVIKGMRDGIECVKKVNEKYSVPVVFLTAHSDDYTIERTKYTNPYGFISKPVEDRDLKINIENALYRSDAEKKLREYREKYYRLAESSKDIIFRYSYTERKLDFINNACFTITGYSTDDFYGNPLLFNIYILPGEFDASHEGTLNVENEYSITDKENNQKWMRLSAIILKDLKNVPYAIEGIVYDITEKVKYEQKITNTNEKLHLLAEHLENIRENERLEISRELHDQFGQDLTGLKLTISLLLKKIMNRDAEIDREYFEQELILVKDKIDEVFADLRRMTTDLRPDLLDRLGLVEAVNWQADNFESKTGINCNLKISGDDSMVDNNTALSFYRIMQELLTNISKHSGAASADVTINFQKCNIELIVCDNGKGMEISRLENIRSFGIIGIQERVYRLAGEIEFNSVPGSGTRCRVKIPL